MNNFQTRREFFRLTAFGLGTAVLAMGVSACDDKLSAHIDFTHGIASGDPLADRVILWTRAVPQSGAKPGPIRIGWEVALDPEFAALVNSGTTETSAERDFTVKIDAAGLRAGTPYYYRFRAQNKISPVGRTRTLPTDDATSIKLAVLSCSNYPAGRFHVYREVAERIDLDAVLHIGDYIYEYQRGGYASEQAQAMGREVLPEHETLSLSDYRTRYAQYRSDADLQLMHQRHPFISVWDDHEIANDSWQDGAENHQPEEGSFAERKLHALQAYSEWMPLRPVMSDDELRIYRSFRFGKLVDLHMLDTRIIGRDHPLEFRDFFTAQGLDVAALQNAIRDPNRSLLGAEQRDWLQNQLTTSTGRWQVLGQQVVCGRMYLPGALATQQIDLSGFARLVKLATMAAQGLSLTSDELAFLQTNKGLLQLPALPYNLDAWDAFEAERENLLQTARGAEANLVVLAGDSHNAWANDLVDAAGEACGVEFATSSVTSPGLEVYLNIPKEAIAATEAQLVSLISQLRYTNLNERGYLVVGFTDEEATAEFIYVDSVFRTDYQILSQRGKILRVKAGANRLI